MTQSDLAENDNDITIIEEDPSEAIMAEARRCLKEVWGYDAFRGVQEGVIRRLCCEGKSAAVLMPTGGGKSLIYQIPAMLFDGLTIVVSPLIALMKDQVDALKRVGLPAASLDSSLSLEDSNSVKADVRNGILKILYVAPERLNNELFREMIMKVNKISLLAIDEAHCISEWGPSFRPDYMKVARFAKEIEAERVLALTATATPSVAEDICKGFDIEVATGLLKSSTYRPNLALKTMAAETLEEKLAVIIPMLKSRTGASIVYVTTQRDAEELVEQLRARGIPEAEMYHAGMLADDRTRVQEHFINSEKGVVCSTIAFGMGIDKATIRQVIHFKMAKTLENYSQEIGRAGRDGLPSECCMLLSAADIPLLEGFARGNTPSLRSIKGWLHEVLTTALDEEECLVFNHYEQAKLYDIKQGTLTLLFAELELTFGIIRATTPYYSCFQWLTDPKLAKHIEADKSKAATILRSHIKKGPKFSTVDVTQAASASGMTRSELASQLSKWEWQTGTSFKGSQVRSRYRIIAEKGLPKGTKTIDKMAQEMYDAMIKRENADVARLMQVVEFATQDDCLAQKIAEYFGDFESVPLGSCGICSYCTTLSPTVFNPAITTTVDEKKAQLILDACHYRDDPRLLARIAFGMASPRTTELRLAKAEDGGPFGCMDNTDFNQLVEYFDKKCGEVKYKNLAKKHVSSTSSGGYHGRNTSSGLASSSSKGYSNSGNGAHKRKGSTSGSYSTSPGNKRNTASRGGRKK